ncbi:hypothetical protein DFH07DRAFT_764841 [Mycena maculata]|uniref:Uncharacterized protein n=1 Tax=Mycena maculata TaxID=230809 RepID=A0AAD7NZ96_9AGAR|nr:hypothetical protein DFH07DRAFT_764841 [Mycena maculata]
MKSPPPQRPKFRLAAPKKHDIVNFIDDKAVEDDHTEDEDENNSTDWSTTPPAQSTGPIKDVSEPTAPLKKIRGHTPQLEKRTMSQRVKLSATVIPAGQRNTQKRLVVTVKQEPREHVSLSAEEYDKSLYHAHTFGYKTPVKAKIEGLPTSQEWLKDHLRRTKASHTEHLHQVLKKLSQHPKGWRLPMLIINPSHFSIIRTIAKRKERSPSEEISQSPKTPSKGKKRQSPPAPKKVKVAHGLLVLQTEDILKKLPKKCQVTNEDVQDPLVKELYTTLPPLLRCVFLSWSPDTGLGNMMYSSWGDMAPENTSMYPVLIPGSYKRSSKSTERNSSTTAVCVTLAMAIQSSVTEISSVVKSKKAVKHKFITAIPHGQEIEHPAGVVGMIFHRSELKTQIRADTITFGTKSQSPQSAQSSQAVQPRFLTGGSRSFASTSAASSGAADALNADNEVPVYDGHTMNFDLEADI